MRRAEQWRQGVAILNACRGDLTFCRQTKRIDGKISFAPIDFLGPRRSRAARRLRWS
jgi:hypothetical protein